MKKFLCHFLLAGVCLLWAGLAQAEILVPVVGDVIGNWGSDDVAKNVDTVYEIRGECRVPPGKSLYIHAGIDIRFMVPTSVIAAGDFTAKGTETYPIHVEAMPGVEAFRFEGEAGNQVSLSHVYFSDDSNSIPEIALTSAGRLLSVDTCRIWAQAIGIRCSNAKASITGSTITKMRAGNAAIKLEDAEGSELTADTVKVCFSTSVFDLVTHGIHLVGSQNATISGSVVTAEGEGAAVGICAERHCSSISIVNSTISVECENYTWPRGIWLPTAGYCRISACDISVRSKNSDQATFWLSGTTSAQVYDCFLYLGGDGKGHFIYRFDSTATYETQRLSTQKAVQRVPSNDRAAEVTGGRVGAAFPNPFNVVTQLPIELGRASTLEVVVFDILGREIDRISCGVLPAGRHLVPLSGSMWASGVYFVSLSVDGEAVAKQRIVLVK